jgi:hypothetical protein
MSTKTTIKSIALVVVSVVTMGMLSAAPANAARSFASGNYVTSISASADYAPVAGTNGTSSVATITIKTDTTTGTLVVSPYVRLVSAPATSGMDQTDSATAVAATELTMGKWHVNTTVGTHTPITRKLSAPVTTTGIGQGGDLTLDTAQASGTGKQGAMRLTAWYDVAGTYVWSIFDDIDASTTLNGAEASTTYTVVVAGASNSQTAVVTSSVQNSTSAAAGASGSLVKITLKDAAGNAINPDATAGVVVTVGGSAIIAKVNDSATSGSPQSYTLGAGTFAAGTAYINVTDATAESVVLTISNSGFGTFTGPAASTLTFKTVGAAASTVAPYDTTGYGVAVTTANSASTFKSYVGSTITLKTDDYSTTAVTTYSKIAIVDSTGALSGISGADWDLAIIDSSTFSLTVLAASNTLAATGEYFTVTPASGTAHTFTNADAVNTTVTATPANVRAIAGAVMSFNVLVEDQFGNVRTAQTVTASIAGRNSAVTVASAATNADGYATLTYTDASTSTTSVTDTITFTSTATDSSTVTFGALGVSTVLTTSAHTTSTGVQEAVATYTDIAQGDGAETGTGVTVTATVKDASAVGIAGVPVTFTVSGTTGAAFDTTDVVGYTGVTGTVSAHLYGWIEGTYTVTATAGGVADSHTVNFAQTSGADAVRTIAVVAVGGTVTATVKDRFGNPVSGVALTASRTGAGNFAGSSSITGTTNSAGQVDFIISNGNAEVTVAFAAATTGQSDAIAGNIDGAAATGAATAYTAGTSLVDAEGVGASFTPVGINSAKVAVTVGASALDDSVSAAADAAAEATDAANAATDAANAAAEAADAATAAAQDAADAVAALSAQVASLISGLKAQLTALTNLVIKIQKKVKA